MPDPYPFRCGMAPLEEIHTEMIQRNHDSIFGCFRIPDCDASAKLDALAERVERIEQRLSYAEFLAGLSSPVDIVVCPADAPINAIARKLGHA